MAAVMFQVSQAILPAAGVIAPVVPPVIPPMLAGVPFGGLGFGLGLGLGFPFMGFGLGALAFRRIALLGLLGRKKRDATDEAFDGVSCTIRNNMIVCIPGEGQRIGCAVEPRLKTIADIRFNLTDLAVSERIEGNGAEVFNLISPRSALHRSQQGGSNSGFVGYLSSDALSASRFTFVHPATLEPVLLSFYFDQTLDLPGFVATDSACYSAIVDVIRTHWASIRFDLFV